MQPTQHWFIDLLSENADFNLPITRGCLDGEFRIYEHRHQEAHYIGQTNQTLENRMRNWSGYTSSHFAEFLRSAKHRGILQDVQSRYLFEGLRTKQEALFIEGLSIRYHDTFRSFMYRKLNYIGMNDRDPWEHKALQDLDVWSLDADDVTAMYAYYAQLPKGVIYLFSFPNGRNYVGQSWRWKQRLRDHKNRCKLNTQPNKSFQNHYNKYGLPEPVILYSNIETQSEMNLLEWRAGLAHNAHYTMGGINLLYFGHRGKHSEKTKQLISKSNLGKKGSDKARERARERTGKKNPNYRSDLREQWYEICEYYVKTESYKDVAQKFNTSHPTITKIINEHWDDYAAKTGKERPDPNNRKKGENCHSYRHELREQWYEICKCYSINHSYNYVARIKKSSAHTIKNIIDEHWHQYLEIVRSEPSNLDTTYAIPDMTTSTQLTLFNEREYTTHKEIY